MTVLTEHGGGPAEVVVDERDPMSLDAKKFQLKAVLKDQKGGRVISASYCHVETNPACHNLLAVVSARMLTIYDDFHMGHHVSVVAQYVHPEDDSSTIQACVWIPGSVDSEMHRASPRLALLLSDGRVAVVSIIESKVTHIIETGLSCSAPRLVAPSTWEYCNGSEYLVIFDPSSGNIYVVDIRSQHGARRVCGSARAVSISHSGDAIYVVRNNDDRVVRLTMSDCDGDTTEVFKAGTSAIKGIVAVDDERCILRLQHCFQLWDIGAGTCLSEWMVKGCKDQSVQPFDSNADLAIVGTDDGDGHVFTLERGEEVSTVSVVRVNSGVEAVALSKDGTHIVLAAGDGFLFRFLYC